MQEPAGQGEKNRQKHQRYLHQVRLIDFSGDLRALPQTDSDYGIQVVHCALLPAGRKVRNGRGGGVAQMAQWIMVPCAASNVRDDTHEGGMCL